MSLHIAIAGPLDVGRLSSEFGLKTRAGQSPPSMHLGGHPSLTNLVVGLAPLVERMDLVTLDTSLDHPIELSREYIRLSVFPQRDRPRDLARNLFATERRYIAQQLVEWNPDVVSAHWTYEYALGTLDSRLPHLITVRDWAPTVLWAMRDRYRTVRLLMQILTFVRGRNFAAASPYMIRRMRFLARPPVSLLPNGLESSWYSDAVERSSESRVVAANHGFDRRKNIRPLLVSWQEVLNEHPTAELVLVGREYEPDGPAHLWAEKNGVSRGVRFLGPIAHEDFKDLLGTAAVFVHTSLEESFGLVVLEAMARGLPVLGGDRSGAVPWILRDGAGMLTNVRDPKAIAAGLSKLLEEPEFADSIARRGYERAMHFRMESIASAYYKRLARIATA